jgi:uncharacterized protein (TIGR03437 family)
VSLVRFGLIAAILFSASSLNAQQQCTSVNLSSSSAAFQASGGDGRIMFTATPSGCPRTVTSGAPWITITFGQEGTGSGSAGYNVQPNTTPLQRIGTIIVAGQTFTVTQSAACLYTLTPPQSTISVNGGTGTFTVTTAAGCTWSAESSVNWVLVTSGASGSGNGSVAFSVAANLQNVPRSTAITVGNTGFIVSQPAAGCDLRIEPESATFASEGGIGSIDISGPSTCSWTATKNVDWVTFTPPVAGSGDGVVRYAVAPNPSVQTRRATITVAGKVFQIVQASANCNVSVAITSMSVGATGGTSNLQITANCEWRAASSVPWIQITSPATGTANATLMLAVQPNTGTVQRTGNITVNAQTVTITQPAQTCTLSVVPATLTLPARGGTAVAEVTGGTSCSWGATSNAQWAEMTWASINGSGRVTVTALPNNSGSERAGSISVGNQSLTVRQPPIVVSITLNGVVNAASFRPGAVAPGEIVTIFGSGFGPATLKTLEISAGGQSITKTIGDTRVLFDGVAAPMIYTSEGQLSAVVPYALASNQSTRMMVEYLGVLSNTLTLPVAPASPAIFSLASSGTGPGAILNQDFSLNTAQAPAARGSIIQMFATGEGQTRPAGVDGRLAVAPLPAPVLPVTVTIGGRAATVVYSGGAPGLVAGVVQINARVPDEVTPGASVPVMIRVGEIASPDGITVAVR